MRDLISRETAKLTLKNYGLNRYMLERMERWIDAQPAVDAVSVVRCDNCKYRYMDADLQVWTCTYGLMIKPNGFCNYGERKESE